MIAVIGNDPQTMNLWLQILLTGLVPFCICQIIIHSLDPKELQTWFKLAVLAGYFGGLLSMIVGVFGWIWS